MNQTEQKSTQLFRYRYVWLKNKLIRVGYALDNYSEILAFIELVLIYYYYYYYYY